jgi:hypothetical protein
MWDRTAACRGCRLQDDRSHRVGHPLHDDRDFDAGADEVPDHVVERQPVGHVAAGAVDVERDGFLLLLASSRSFSIALRAVSFSMSPMR